MLLLTYFVLNMPTHHPDHPGRYRDYIPAYDFAFDVTFPSSKSVSRNATVTKATVLQGTVSGNGYLLLTWYYDGSVYVLLDDWHNVILATGQYTTLLGYLAGENAAGADNSVFVGYGAGQNYPTAGAAVCIGYGAGNNPGGYAGVFIGYLAGNAGGGTSAVGVGYGALRVADGSGTGNVAIGVHAAEQTAGATGLIAIGYHAANDAGTTANNSVIGDHCAGGLANLSNCIILGPYAGMSRNNTLWIEGTAGSVGAVVPLIYGEFDNKYLKINGNFEVPAGYVSTAGNAIITKSTASNYTVGTTDAREAYGGVVYVTSAATISLPAIAVGMSVTVITIGAIAVSVDPNGSEVVFLDGVALTGGHKITNLSTAGDIAVLTYKGSGVWYAATNAWTDGG